MEAREMGKQVRDTAQDLGNRAKAMGSAAWERAVTGCNSMQEKAITGMKATDQTIRTHPYQAIGIAFGVGILMGVMMRRKR